MATQFLERLQIPEGFEKVLHDLIREILRDQPKDINYYSLKYFECMKSNQMFNGQLYKNGEKIK